MTTTAPMATFNSAPEPTAAERRRSSRRDDGPEAGVSLSFDVTLDLARDAILSRVRHAGTNSESANQVFEAEGTDPGQARVDAQRAADEREAQQKADGPLDAASVKARRAEATSTPSTDRVARGGASDSDRTHVLPEPNARRDPGAGMVEPTAARNAHAAPGPSSRLAVTEQEKSAAEPTAPAVAPRQQAPVPGAALPSAAPVAGRSVSSSGEVAARVGEVLGAQRGGAESARATQATDAPPQRQGRSGQTPSKPSASTPQSEDGRSPRQADTTPRSERGRFDELVQSLRIRTGSHRSTARMHLHPPSWGRLLIDVRMEGERLQLNVRTETAEATQLMQARIRELQAALAQHGFTVERFDVQQHMHGAVSDSSDGGQAYAQFDGRADRGIRQSRLDEDRSMAGLRGEGEPISHHVVAERRLDVRI